MSIISKEFEYLKDWLRRFLENKDIVLKNIKSVKESDEGLLVKYKTKEHVYLIVPFLKDSIISEIKKREGHVSLVIYNTEENFKYILAQWKELVAVGRHFSIYCVNPFSKLEKKWIVFPFTHNQIAEGQNIKEGLKSLTEMVESTTEKEVLEITK